MPFQWGAPDIILLFFVVAIPAAIVWALYRVVRKSGARGNARRNA
jgi:hypothetical protein